MSVDLTPALWGVLQLGTAGPHDPVYAGTIVFGLAALVLAYLCWVRTEMDAGVVMKAGTVLMFVLALVATYWPQRPWPH